MILNMGPCVAPRTEAMREALEDNLGNKFKPIYGIYRFDKRPRLLALKDGEQQLKTQEQNEI